MNNILGLTLKADFIGFVGHNNCSMYNYIYTFSDAVWWVIQFLIINKERVWSRAIHCASDIVGGF